MGRRDHVYETLLLAVGQGTVGSDYDECYTYDKLSRLVNWQIKNNSGVSDLGTSPDAYAYDMVGNRTSIDSSTSSYHPAVYNDGRSSSINSDILKEDPSYTYEYDQNGSLIKRTVALPETVHQTWTKIYHGGVPSNLPATPGAVGGDAGGVAEEDLSDGE